MTADPGHRLLPDAECEDALLLLEAVASTHPDAMFVKDLAGTYLYCNTAAARMLGRTLGEIVGQTDDDLFDERAVQLIRAQDSRVMGFDREESEEHELEIGGRLCLFQTTKSPFRSRCGEIVGVVGILRDITAQKEAEISLRESEQRYRSLVTAMSEGVVFHSANGEIWTCNEAAERILGLTSDQICGRTSLDSRWHCVRTDGTIFPGKQHPAMVTLGTGKVVSGVEMGVRKPDGCLTWISINSEPLFRPNELAPYAVVCSFSDITDRKQSDDALRESQRRLAEAQTIAHIGSWEWNPNSGRVWWSDSLYKIFGIPVGSVQPGYDVFLSLLHPDDRGTAEARVKAMLADSDEFANDLRIIRPDGEILWLHSRARATRDVDGRIIRVEGTDQDITDRKAAEKTMRLMQFSIDKAVDAVFWVDEVGRILYANDAACKTLGYTHEELVNQSLDSLNSVCLGKDWRAHWESLKREGSLTLESEYRTTDGRLLVTEVTSNYLQHEGQEYNCVTLRDISLRRRAEQERDRLWNHAMDPICIASFDGKLRQVNPAWTRTLGWSETELNSRPWLEFVHPSDRDATAEAAQQLASGQSVTGFLNRYRTRSGEYRWFSWNSIPQPETGSIFGFIRDVTQSKILEEQLRQAQKMEAIGRLAGGIAHDFNNLLTVINGYSELLLKLWSAEEALSLPLTAIRNAGNRAAELTAQLLAFSRKAIIEPKILDLNEVIASTSKMLRRLISEDITLNVNLYASPGLIRADPGQLERIIMNLTVNACDAMPTGGQLTLETSTVTISDEDINDTTDLIPGQYIRLTVSDTGHGMSEDTRGKIFEPFFTTKEMGKGTGLGLSVVHGVVKQCGGHILVSSVVDGGTTFELMIPQAEGLVSAVVDDPLNSTRRCSETLLLVEDNDAVRNIAKIALRAQGFVVLEARSGAEAVQLHEQFSETIQLLITDVVMPGMGGRKLADVLRHRAVGLRVLYISGHSDNEVLLQNPSEAFLQKPFTPAGLVRKVRAMLDGEKSRNL